MQRTAYSTGGAASVGMGSLFAQAWTAVGLGGWPEIYWTESSFAATAIVAVALALQASSRSGLAGFLANA